MAPSQTIAESRIIELAEKSFNTFCEDISGMFGIDMKCAPQPVGHETVKGLQARFQDLAVVYSAKAEGALDSTLKLVFDQQGLFILAGVVAMQPEQMIIEDAKSDSLEKAVETKNILKEVGAALTGAWERIFSKGLEGHGRFVLTDTFVGNPWDTSEEKIDLAADEEFVFVPYEMTVGLHPAFKCGVIFQKAIFDEISESENDQSESTEQIVEVEAEEKSQVEPEQAAQENTEENIEGDTEQTTQDQKTDIEKVDSDESDTTQQSDNEKSEPQEPAVEMATEEKTQAEKDAEQTTVTEEDAAAAEKAQSIDEETAAADESAAKHENEAAAEQKMPNDVEETATVEMDEKQERSVSETIQKMTESPAVLPGEAPQSTTTHKTTLTGKDTPLIVCAKDIMQKDVIWANPDESVQQALAKIQQHNAGYMVVGRENVLEGIVSKSDLAAALSPYLRNIFAKWRRPLDDATLQIRIKWIMSKPTCTIVPDTPLAAVMENMCQAGIRCLPVVDEMGGVQGLVTAFDIFKVLLKQSYLS
jgi:CBS domain-containing protein